MNLSIHRKEQWDLDCWPWLCVHLNTLNRNRRIFCIWRGGIQIGRIIFVWSRRRPVRP